MNQVAIRMQEDIPIVSAKYERFAVYETAFEEVMKSSYEPVFHLQQIRNQTIGRTAVHEILLGGFEILRFGATIFIHEILAQTFIGILFDLMQRNRIQYRLDESTVI